MNKSTYTEVASIINAELKKHDDGNFKPRVTVVNTAHMGKYCDKWSISVNDEAYDLIQRKGKPQGMFYADEVYVVGDDDLYIEPYNSFLFNLAVM